MVGILELKRYLGLGSTDEVDVALLEQLEREELASFEQRTNRYFGPVATLVETLSARGRRSGVTRSGDRFFGTTTLRLCAPVVTLTSVEVLGVRSFIGGTGWSSPWALSAFETDGNVLTLIDGSVFPHGNRNVRVTYEGGYAAGQEPSDVRGAIKQRVANRYRERHTSTEAKPAPPITASSDAVEAVWRRNPGL